MVNPAASALHHPSREDQEREGGREKQWRVALLARGENELKFDVFAEQLLYHVLFPASLIVYLWRHGFKAAINQVFIPARCSGDQLFVYTFLVLATYMVSFAFVVELFTGACFRSEAIFAILVFLMRNLTIAAKYGYMAPCVYRRFLLASQPVASEISQDEQFISGWLRPKDRQVRRHARRWGD